MQDSSRADAYADKDRDYRRPSGRSRWWYLLLLIPLIALLYPPFYAHMHPMLGGVPFFIWYQFAWVFGSVATTLTVSMLTD